MSLIDRIKSVNKEEKPVLLYDNNDFSFIINGKEFTSTMVGVGNEMIHIIIFSIPHNQRVTIEATAENSAIIDFTENGVLFENFFSGNNNLVQEASRLIGEPHE